MTTTRKTKTAPADEPLRARVLVDVPAHGLKAGDLLTASAEIIAALAESLDTHPDAVAYAIESGAPTATLN